jgi:hypothetical protein
MIRILSQLKLKIRQLPNGMRETLHQIFFFVLCILVALAAFILVLVVPIPTEMGVKTGISSGMRYLLLSFFIPVFLIYRWNTKKGVLISIGLTFALFALPLRQLWNGEVISYSAIGGLLPYSDASGYYYDARNMIEGLLISRYSVNASRLIFTSTMGSLLYITGQNLLQSVTIIAFINATACYRLAREVQRIWGTLLAVILLFLLFSFYKLFSGIFLSESLGFPIGVLAAAVTLHGIHNRKRFEIAFGIFLFTLTIQIRPGAMLIIPALLVWILYSARSWWNKTDAKKFAITCFAGFAAAIFIIWLFTKFLGSPIAENFSQVSYLVLALVRGGVHPEEVLKQYPELASNLNQAEVNRFLFHLAWESFKNQPGTLFSGIYKVYASYFSTQGAFVFIFGKSKLASGIVLILFVVGLLKSIAKWRNPVNSFILFTGLGILASVPLANYVGYRAYSASFAISFLLVIVGLSVLTDLINQKAFFHDSLQEIKHNKIATKIEMEPGLATTNRNIWNQSSSFLISLLVSIFICFAPLVIKISHKPIFLQAFTCPAGQEKAIVRVSKDSYIHIIGENQKTKLPDLSIDHFQKSLMYSDVPSFKESLMNIPASSILMNAFFFDNKYTADNLSSYNQRQSWFLWVVSRDDVFPSKEGIYSICGNYGDIFKTIRIPLFYAESWHNVD